ncbi:MAG: PilN domain-containing protein [Zoogloeaceae bacterium]|jgi:type IV pilus assembly protein PilN|nr:PilN domain-containing protein [Zoogloeaceae bacterium]
MIRINLLPYKEELRKAKRQQFGILAVAFAAAAAFAVFVAYALYGVAIDSQDSRNQRLQAGIDSTKRQLQEIEEIKAKSAALLGRKNAIESLQKDRNNTVRLLSEMVQQTPEGIYLTSLQQTGANVEIKGFAQSSSRVSILMRNIEASRWMNAPMLKEVKAVVVRGRRVPEFIMTFQAVDKGEATEEGRSPAAAEDEGAALDDVATDANAAAGGAPESASLPPPAPTSEGEAATAPATTTGGSAPVETAKEG